MQKMVEKKHKNDNGIRIKQYDTLNLVSLCCFVFGVYSTVACNIMPFVFYFFLEQNALIFSETRNDNWMYGK